MNPKLPLDEYTINERTVADYNYGVVHSISFQTTSLRNVFVGYGYRNIYSKVCLAQQYTVILRLVKIEHKLIQYPYTGTSK